jgi:hypothetical protein
MSARKLFLLLAGALLVQGCLEEDYSGGGEACPGESLEYQQAEYCVLIEEGFLTEDCPEAFPEGREIDGVIVCAREGESVPDEIKEELRDRGWIEDEVRCEADSDCPDGEDYRECQGTVLLSSGGSVGVCQEGVCELLATPGALLEQDCAELGQVCRDGACVDPGGRCASDEECAVPEPAPYCEGDVVITPGGCFGSCEQGMCQTSCADGWGERDCASEGQVCREGACVDPGGMECVSDEECPQPIPFFGCEGDVAIRASAYGFCEDGVCQIEGEQVEEDCGARGRDCQDGQCVARSCEDDSVCPDGPDYRACEGDVALFSTGAIGVCLEGVCEQLPTPGALLQTDCAEMGQVCRDGECVEEGPLRCGSDEECYVPPTEPFCMSDEVAVVGPSQCAGYCTDAGVCQVDCDAGWSEQDCAETGQICRDGACVDPNGGACEGDDDCPDLPEYRECEGTVRLYASAAPSACLDGQCIYPPIALLREDCAESGLTCYEGECVEPGGMACMTNEDCPVPPTLPPYCEDGVAVVTNASSVCAQGQCLVRGFEERTDCEAQGQACQEGQCVGGDMCQTELDCPQVLPPLPVCEGDVRVTFSPTVSCERGLCVIDGNEEREDCAERELVCVGGECVPELIGPDNCRSDLDCPVSLPAIFCEGDVAVTVFTRFSCDVETRMCVGDSSETRMDCAAQGLVCQDGFCQER